MKKNSLSFSRIKQSFHRDRRRRSSPVHIPVEERHRGASSALSPTLSDVAITRTPSPTSSINSQEERHTSPPISPAKSQDSLHIHADDLWGEALRQISIEDKELVQAYNEILNQAAGVQGNDIQAISQHIIRLKRTQVLNRQWRLR